MAKAKAWVAAHKSLTEEKDMLQKSEDSKLQRFEFQIPVLKARQIVSLDKDGNEVIERFVEGVASTTDKDLHGDRMAPEAIESMANSLKQHVILLNAEHDRSWQSELGEVTELSADEHFNLLLKAKLDKTSKANDLWYALTEKNKKLGLSVGGYVKDVELVSEEDEDGEESWVRVYKDIELDHVAVTSSPANPKTWVSVIAKSLETTNEEINNNNINERSVPNMVDKNSPLEADEVKDDSASSESQEEPKDEVKESAEPENGKSEDESKEATEEESTETEEASEEGKEEESQIDEESPKPDAEKESAVEEKPDEESKEEETDKGSEEESEEKDESDEDKSEEKSDEEAEEKSEEKSEEEDKEASKSIEAKQEDGAPDVTKALSNLLIKVDEVLKGQDALTDKIESLEKRVDGIEEQPAGRKVAIEKGIGEEDAQEEASEEAIEKKIADLKKNNPNDPNLFAKIQRIRSENKV